MGSAFNFWKEREKHKGCKFLGKGFASFITYDTFAIRIFERFIKLNINAYHSTTCKKRKSEIDL
jgi:hypothetical protein